MNCLGFSENRFRVAKRQDFLPKVSIRCGSIRLQKQLTVDLFKTKHARRQLHVCHGVNDSFMPGLLARAARSFANG